MVTLGLRRGRTASMRASTCTVVNREEITYNDTKLNSKTMKKPGGAAKCFCKARLEVKLDGEAASYRRIFLPEALRLRDGAYRCLSIEDPSSVPKIYGASLVLTLGTFRNMAATPRQIPMVEAA